jgi:hypothetical protein
VRLPRPVIAGRKSFAISVWLRTSMASRADIYVESRAGSRANVNLNINEDGRGTLRLVWRTDVRGMLRADAPPDIADGRWHHVVASGEGSALSVYVDGRLAGRKSGRQADLAVDRASILGMIEDRPGAFRGDVDEVRIYGRALGEEDAAGLFKRGRQER